MAKDFDTLPERVDVIERKLDSLSASVDDKNDFHDCNISFEWSA